ncbi:MAG: hypothetical protein ACXWCG_13365 [Flavitalea sp.]
MNKKEEMFNRLVENAFDFLSVAIDDLINNRPKYSVIHFYAAVELFIKARLMAEHWSLVVVRDADWTKFLIGDFQSVTLSDAAIKLEKIVASKLSDEELKAFKKVGEHRNKMVHFFHVAHVENKDKEVATIVKEQLNAWYFLHKRLSDQWKDVFAPWSTQINEINKSLKRLIEFLNVVFEKLSPEIEKLNRKGFIFRICPSCGFKAQKHDTDQNIVYESECLVCELTTEQCLRIECPDCGELVFFENEGFATCENEDCGKKFEPEELASILTDEDAAYTAAKDGDDSYGPGNCSACAGYHTVIKTTNDTYLCTCCFSTFGEYGSIECCAWCNEPNTGDMGDSYIFGCNYCEGLVGWHKDD